jgi:hypothetical protein
MLKAEFIEPPKIYLGGSARKLQLDNGVECWVFRSSLYVQLAVKNVEEYLNKRQEMETAEDGRDTPENEVPPRAGRVTGAAAS